MSHPQQLNAKPKFRALFLLQTTWLPADSVQLRAGKGSNGVLRLGRLGVSAWAAVLGVFTATGVRSDEQGFQELEIAGARVHWRLPSGDKPLVLHFAFATRDVVTPEADNCGLLRPASKVLTRSKLEGDALRHAAAVAFARWQRVANIAFVETANQDDAEIVIGEQGVAKGRAYTNVTLTVDQGAKYRQIKHAMICLNPEKPWKNGFDGNLASYDLVHTLTHEIGHVIGLDHPSARGHLMSFVYDEAEDGLSEGDIRGAVQIYGPARAGAALSINSNHSRALPGTFDVSINKDLASEVIARRPTVAKAGAP